MLMINLNENNVASITTNYVNDFSLKKKTMSIIYSEKKYVNNYIYIYIYIFFLIPNLTLLLLLFNQPTLCL